MALLSSGTTKGRRAARRSNRIAGLRNRARGGGGAGVLPVACRRPACVLPRACAVGCLRPCALPRLQPLGWLYSLAPEPDGGGAQRLHRRRSRTPVRKVYPEVVGSNPRFGTPTIGNVPTRALARGPAVLGHGPGALQHPYAEGGTRHDPRPRGRSRGRGFEPRVCHTAGGCAPACVRAMMGEARGGDHEAPSPRTKGMHRARHGALGREGPPAAARRTHSAPRRR